MEQQVKVKDSSNIPQSSKDKIRALERHPEMLGCIDQVRNLALVAMSAGSKYPELDLTGFVSKCPEVVDLSTLPRGWNK